MKHSQTIGRLFSVILMSLLFLGCAARGGVESAAPTAQASVEPGVSDSAGEQQAEDSSRGKGVKKRCYPREFRMRGLENAFVVTVKIATDGSGSIVHFPADVAEEWRAPAECVISQLTFRPGRSEGRAVEGFMQVPITFSLSGASLSGAKPNTGTRLNQHRATDAPASD